MPKRVALVLALAGLLLWLGFRDEVLGPLLVLWRVEVAKAVLGLIHWAGMEATREATAIYHPGGFAYEISRGCTGFVPTALLATAISAYPAAGRAKLVGLVLGLPLLLAVNLARLVHLYYVGVRQPHWFETTHQVLWEILIIVAVVGIWLAWAAWADRRARRRARIRGGSSPGLIPPGADR